MATLSFKTTKKIELLDITESVREVVSTSGVREGICLVFVPHATAGLLINEWEPRLVTDIERTMARLVPRGDYAHNVIDDNAEAHLSNILVGCERSIPIIDGDLALGTWQRIILCEFDGPRTRKVLVICR
ncbi:MAG: secondary thiamine-phosphate synthase enzyme YjbQ [Candidatus Micrarchaeia archaeon]